MITIRNVKIRLQLVNESYREQIAQFINDQFLSDEGLSQAVGLNEKADKNVASECAQIGKHYAGLALDASPTASVIAINEAKNQLVGIRLSMVSEMSSHSASNKETQEYALSFPCSVLSIMINTIMIKTVMLLLL